MTDISGTYPQSSPALLSVLALGAPHSWLAETRAAYAPYMNILSKAPGQAGTSRSDQYGTALLTAGIPALHLKYGNKTADGRNLSAGAEVAP
jgi:hypothetical protein